MKRFCFNTVNEVDSAKFRNGVTVVVASDAKDKNWIYTFDQQLIGLGEVYLDEQHEKRIRVIFNLAC